MAWAPLSGTVCDCPRADVENLGPGSIFLMSSAQFKFGESMKLARWVISVSLLLGLGACSADPMEACMKQGLEKKLPADGADRGAYIKAREQVRVECEKKLK
jgi:hypothetical protein